jgi:large subunit ribosomal protein L10
MLRKKKVQVVDDLQELFARFDAGILTDYRGLTAQEMTGLRRVLRRSGVGYRVVKNTLARLAVQRSGREELVGLFDGPVAIAFGDRDITELAKLLAEHIKASKTSLSVKGGFLGDRLLTADEVKAIATLPSREALLAKVVGGMQSPIYALVHCLNAPLQGMVGVLQSRVRQLEGG